ESSARSEAGVRRDPRNDETRNESFRRVPRVAPRSHDEDARRGHPEKEQAVGNVPDELPGRGDLRYEIERRGREEEIPCRPKRRRVELRLHGAEPRGDRLDDLRREVHYVPSTRRRMSTNIGASAARPYPMSAERMAALPSSTARGFPLATRYRTPPMVRKSVASAASTPATQLRMLSITPFTSLAA